jgi:hypothetical protein
MSPDSSPSDAWSHSKGNTTTRAAEDLDDKSYTSKVTPGMADSAASPPGAMPVQMAGSAGGGGNPGSPAPVAGGNPAGNPAVSASAPPAPGDQQSVVSAPSQQPNQPNQPETMLQQQQRTHEAKKQHESQNTWGKIFLAYYSQFIALYMKSIFLIYNNGMVMLTTFAMPALFVSITIPLL